MNIASQQSLLEAKHHLDRLAELAVAIYNAGLVSEAAAFLTAETEVDYLNGVALLGRTATDPVNKAEYDRMVARLGYAPTLDMTAYVNNDLRESFATALLALNL